MLWIGTSGWQYRHWADRFYPPGLPQRAWLDHYCERFRTVEVNNTFYNLPAASTFASWRERTPADFVVTVKLSRYLTHVKRLSDPEEPVQRFMERARELGSKAGPVLLQLPPRFEVRPERLARTLEALAPWKCRVAVEFRDETWYTPAVRGLLERHGAALVLADSPRRRQPAWRTADWGFVRFHEGRARPRPCYGEQALRSWVERLGSTWSAEEDVFAYFNNDPEGCALRDAVMFARLARRAGLRTTRVPAAGEIRVGPVGQA